jgi:hypothetical protein
MDDEFLEIAEDQQAQAERLSHSARGQKCPERIHMA